MTTSEIIQAEELARWIDGEKDTLPSAECSVAMWAMRPDLAPSPRVTLDDVLARVTSGPFFETEVGEYSVSEDDFVEALFTQSRNSTQTKVSLDDILTRIESGPFARLESEGISEKVEEAISIPTSANNNRWWSSPFLAGGLAVALVLFVLIPTQFTATVPEDSMFTTSFDAEEPLPAAEMDANIVSKQQNSPERSLTLEGQSTLVKREETVITEQEIAKPLPEKALKSSAPKTIEKPTVNETVFELEEPSPLEEIQAIPTEPMNSYKSESTIASSVTNDLSSNQLVKEADVLNGQYDAGSIGDIEGEAVATKQLLNNPTEDVADEGAAVPPVKMSADDSEPQTFARPSKRTKKNRSRMSQRIDLEDDPMQAPMPMDKSPSESISIQLPNVLTAEQQRLLEQTTNLNAVLVLCNANQPTQALDILWTASSILSIADAITALKRSSKYDHGDVRYLKRNWLRLSSLLYQTGQEEEAMKYQQLASSLP